MNSDAQEMERKLQALHRSFYDKVARLLDEMARVLEQAGGPGDDSTRRAALGALESEAHKMAGTAGTFGLDGLTAPARALEEGCSRINEQSRPTTPGEHAALVLALQRLRDAYAAETIPTP